MTNLYGSYLNLSYIFRIVSYKSEKYSSYFFSIYSNSSDDKSFYFSFIKSIYNSNY